MKSTFRQVARILGKVHSHRLYHLVDPAAGIHWSTRFLLTLLQAIFREPDQARGERLRDALLELGPVYIKLGQLLSTRPDLIPEDISRPLRTLQDNVPPIDNFDVRAFLEEELGTAHEGLFARVDASPLASASIAQVHTAELLTGEEVVLKIVRPGIRQQIEADMSLLETLAERLSRTFADASRMHLPRVMADHRRVLLSELDMRAEGSNQLKLRRNFAESNLLYVPQVYSEFTTQRLLVMERVYGIPINQVDRLRELGVDLRVLAHKGVETFFTQVFEHNFFHADMHPGNILIDVRDPADPKYIALDCAIIGSLGEDDQNYLALNLAAFFDRNFEEVARLHLQSGWVPAHTDVNEFATVIRTVCEPIFAKPLSEISFGEFVVTLFRTAGQFEMEIQPQLVLLQKTLLYIEGLGRQLYPDLDLWETAHPFIRAWVTRRSNPVVLLADWIEGGPTLWNRLLTLPRTLEQNQTDLQLMKSEMRATTDSLTRIESELSRGRRRRQYKQVAGIALVVFSVSMLWQPIAQGLGEGNVSMLVGLVSAFLGSALLVRT